MTRTATMRHIILACMFLLAAGSLFIHMRVHSPFHSEGPGELSFTNSAASILSFIDLFAVTFLFSRKKTAAWGYLFNGLIVIYGTVLMTHWGWVRFHYSGAPITHYLSAPTTMATAIALGDFALGAILYKLWFARPEAKTTPTGEKPA